MHLCLSGPDASQLYCMRQRQLFKCWQSDLSVIHCFAKAELDSLHPEDESSIAPASCLLHGDKGSCGDAGTIRLGQATPSFDAECEVSQEMPWEHVTGVPPAPPSTLAQA